MAKKCWRLKQQMEPKFSARRYNRCGLCGRARAYYRKFNVCRCCLRKLALEGKIPGMQKASW
ncbi:MAG: type Z 30S ribosomal protein S14 [Candidatus Brocadiia bacterium]